MEKKENDSFLVYNEMKEKSSKEKISFTVDKDHSCLKEKKDMEREKYEEISLWSSDNDLRHA